MRRAAPFGILVAFVALVGAPALVRGATNLLHDPRVTPSSGTTATDFVLAVEYTGKFAASSVVVDVAGMELAATRVAGTARDGTWRVATKLPAGSWTVVFRATATQGTVPTLAAGVVLVVDDVPGPTPGQSLDGMPQEPPATTSPPPQAPVEPTPAVADAPSNGAAPAASAAAPAASPQAVPTDDVEVGGGSVSGDSPAQGGAPAPSPASPAAPAAGGAGDDPSAAVASPREASTDPVGPTSAIESDASVTGVLVIGLAAIAGVAIAGMAILLALRRRDVEVEEPAAATVTAGTEILTAARRRASRRTTTALEEDPIIAALGIEAGPARQSRGVHSERAARPRRR